ncbi:hypothetical protein [Actinomadura oligospora]|uniref:hypothetical protein n=1 Tax=Actinomadura oligospora TaxID=111804 RepID=UPI000478F754|nr:hypothetical protein [Actinomadura oligospora]
MTAPNPAPPATSEISLVEAVWRYRLMSSLIVVACVLASVAATAFLLGGATATARFAVTDPTNNNNVLRQGVVSGPGYAAYTAQRAAFAGSAPVLGRASELIKAKHGPALTAAALRGRVKTSTKPDSGVVIVSASGGDVPEAALIANAVVQAYQEQTIATATAKLDTQLKNIQNSEREITRSLESTPSTTREGRVLAANLAKLQSQESGVLSARANANDGVQFVDSADPGGSTPNQLPQNAVIGLAIGAILACVISFLRATSGGPLRRGPRGSRPGGPERRIEAVWSDDEVYGPTSRPALPAGHTSPNPVVYPDHRTDSARHATPPSRRGDTSPRHADTYPRHGDTSPRRSNPPMPSADSAAPRPGTAYTNATPSRQDPTNAYTTPPRTNGTPRTNPPTPPADTTPRGSAPPADTTASRANGATPRGTTPSLDAPNPRAATPDAYTAATGSHTNPTSPYGTSSTSRANGTTPRGTDPSADATSTRAAGADAYTAAPGSRADATSSFGTGTASRANGTTSRGTDPSVDGTSTRAAGADAYTAAPGSRADATSSYGTNSASRADASGSTGASPSADGTSARGSGASVDGAASHAAGTDSYSGDSGSRAGGAGSGSGAGASGARGRESVAGDTYVAGGNGAWAGDSAGGGSSRGDGSGFGTRGASDPDGRRVAGARSGGGRHSAGRGADAADPLGVDPLSGGSRADAAAESGFGRAPELGASNTGAESGKSASAGDDGAPAASGRSRRSGGRSRSGGSHSRGSSREDGSFRDPAKALETGLASTPPRTAGKDEGEGAPEGTPSGKDAGSRIPVDLWSEGTSDSAGDPGRTVEDLRIVDDEMLAAVGLGKSGSNPGKSGSAKGDASSKAGKDESGRKAADAKNAKDTQDGDVSKDASGETPPKRYDLD